MSDLPRTSANQITANVTVNTTVETLIVSTVSIPVPLVSGFAFIWAFAQLTQGAGGTTCTPRIRRGNSTTGTLVGTANAVTTIAGNTVTLEVAGLDSYSAQDAAQYSLTLQQGAGSANGTCVGAAIIVFII